MDSFNKVYKLKVLKTKPGPGADVTALMKLRGQTTSLQAAIDQGRNTWREKNGKTVGFRYLQELMLDTMGHVPPRVGDEIGARLRGGYVGFALGANPKVLLTQLSSLAASTSVISRRSHVAGAFIRAKGVDDYSIVAKLRHEDGNTVAKAQGVVESINEKADFFMKGISLFDRLVVRRAFAACQAEVAMKQKLKIGSEENLKAAGKLLDKVILETQQNTFASSKTAAARRGGVIAKTLQMFKSDAVKGAARVVDAWGETNYLKKRLGDKDISAEERADIKARLKESKKALEHSLSAVAMSAAYMVLVAELFRGLYGQGDDDEEQSEAWRRRLTEAIGNLFGGLPIISEGLDYFFSKYGGVEAMEFSAINDLLGTVQDLFEYIGDEFAGKNDGKDRLKILEKVIYGFGQLFGIPARNIKNFTYGILKLCDGNAAYRWDSAVKNQSYGADLEAAIAAGDMDLAVTIVELAMREKLGSGLSDGAIGELARLAALGESVLPSAVGDTVTVDGEERELSGSELSAVRAKYAEAVEQINKFVEGDFYKGLSDEDKAAAVRKIYTLYKDLGYDSTLGTERDKKALILSKVIGDEALVLWEVAGVIDGDRDGKGETVDGSKKENVIEAIMAADLTKDEKLLLIGMRGYKLQGGDIEGMTGYEARSRLYEYIKGLEGLSDGERLELFEKCGFADGDEDGMADEPLPSDVDNSYKKDLTDALERGDKKEATEIIGLAIREHFGKDATGDTVKELLRLAGLEKDILPSGIADSISVGGKERELTAAEYKAAFKKYSVATAQVEKLISGDFYKNLSDNQKASAVNKVFAMYKDISYDTTLGTERDVKATMLSKIVPAEALVLWECSGVLESDKDENGKTVSGSKKAKIVNAIWSADIPDIQKLLLIGMKGYKIDDDDIPGLMGYQAGAALYNYIGSLEGLSDGERLELFKSCGFEVKDGEAQAPTYSERGGTSNTTTSGKKTSSKSIRKIGWVLGGGSMIGSMHGADYTKKIVKLGKVKN